MTDAPPAGEGGGGPPWIRPEIQQDIVWRDGDVVIAVPAKSGTTWTMNIVYQLFTGGTTDFRDIYEEVPWIEFLGAPDVTPQHVHDLIGAMPQDRRRAFKSHSAPPLLPFIESDSGTDLKYIVVFRNPEEAMVSFWPFMGKHSDDWFALWGMPAGALRKPDFQTFYNEIIAGGGFAEHGFFGFLEAWWPLRHEPNVLFMHFADMKRDHEGSIRKVAAFLGVDPTADEWERILEYTSFAWMKQHEDMFEASTPGKVPILQRGAMLRQGQAGKAKADGMTPEISAEVRALGEQVVSDPAALEWYYKGGPLP